MKGRKTFLKIEKKENLLKKSKEQNLLKKLRRKNMKNHGSDFSQSMILPFHC